MTKGERKRPREASSVNTDLVAIYEDLAHENGAIRRKAIDRLVTSEFGEDQLGTILKRLFRGLCSSRKAARLGFSTALTEFLRRRASNQDAVFSPQQAFDILIERTTPIPGAAGQELKDYYFGRLFAVEAMVKSRIVIATQSLDIWSSIVDTVLELYGKKQWLREQCSWILNQAIAGLEGEENFRPFAVIIFEKLSAHNLLKSLEGIAIWITFQSSGFTGHPISSSVFKNNDPLDDESRAFLLNTLKGAATLVEHDHDNAQNASGEVQTAKSKAAGNSTWSNQLHWAWLVVFEAVRKKSRKAMLGYQDGANDGPSFVSLFLDFVDKHLFSNSASEQRKYWGFLMVQHFVPKAIAPGQLLGKNFLRCFSNQLAKADRHLHGIAMKTLTKILQGVEILNTVEGEQGPAEDILFHLLDSAECQLDFDKITKTKFVEKLVSKTKPQHLAACVDVVIDRMTKHQIVDRTPAQYRVLGADFLLAITKQFKKIKNESDDAFMTRAKPMFHAVVSLTRFAYSKVTPISEDFEYPTPEIDRQTRELFRARLLSALSHSITQMNDPSEVAARSASVLLDLSRVNQTPPISESGDEVFNLVVQAGQKMRKCEKRSGSEEISGNKIYKAFRLLFSLSIVQAFSGEADAVDILEELGGIFESFWGNAEQGDTNSIGLVEIILSLMSKPSALFRRVGKEVFTACASMVDVEGLESMFEILQKKETLAGQQELFENEDQDEDMDNEDSDVKESGEASDSEQADSGLDDEGNEEDGADEEEILDFENKLAEALGTRRIDMTSSNGNETDSDEDMMDDEQMTALDPVMANMFKQRKHASSKKENKNAKDTIVQFKSKVLELLEIYVRETSADNDGKLLLVIAPCIECIRTTKNKQVADKAAGVIRAALNSYKLSADALSQPKKKIASAAKQCLRQVHDLLFLSEANIYVRSCSQASLLTAKIMLNNGSSGTLEKVWKEYSKTGKSMLVTDTRVIGVLFQDWFNWLTTAKLTLAKR